MKETLQKRKGFAGIPFILSQTEKVQRRLPEAGGEVNGGLLNADSFTTGRRQSCGNRK